MIQKKRKSKKTAAPGTAEPTSQSAGIWYNIKEQKPPLFKIVNLKTKSGKIITDCARIPDGDLDFYIHDVTEYNNINDITEWMIPAVNITPETKSISNKKKKRD